MCVDILYHMFVSTTPSLYFFLCPFFPKIIELKSNTNHCFLDISRFFLVNTKIVEAVFCRVGRLGKKRKKKLTVDD